MFTKILIANRGEIACRVMATCQKLNIKTVAVYSDADEDAKHVYMADEAVYIGTSPVAESYLLGHKIIEAALETGAEAVHPGYGFLSENPDFVDQVEKAGLVFIGPSASAIRAMGLKDAAKTMMEKANVPVVPGYHGESQDPKFLKQKAAEIGYPVMIKARAGGGGKGMRLVTDPTEFEQSLLSAQREGQTSFGDPACLIEKYITHPRHIEIQVFGDGHGNVVHLFERDCSLQRRHQKVIEEAPAPGMTDEMRSAMGKAACEAARAVNYQGAGTVEFIVDGSNGLHPDKFWFMEMNTRLQVEHPVSEAITGFDFVDLQLQIAAGEKLPFCQDDLTINGWSFEARLYAEDVPKGFLPATGTVSHLSFPKGTEFQISHTRIDSGIRNGDEISPYYDPMIAKIITHGPNRQIALQRLTTALSQCQIIGLTTNVEFLAALSRNKDFSNGDVDTGLIERNLEDLLTKPTPPASIIALATALSLGYILTPQSDDPWDNLIGWRQWSPAKQVVTLLLDDQPLECELTVRSKTEFSASYAGSTIEFSTKLISNSKLSVRIGNMSQQYDIALIDDIISIGFDGYNYAFKIPQAAGVNSDDEEQNENALIASMPGIVVSLSASVGQKISKGDVLIVLEAMKMETSFAAPRDGIIENILVSKGDRVDDGSQLITLQAIEEG